MYMIKIIPKQRKQKKNTLIGIENKLTVVRGDGRGGWVKKVKGSKRYDPLVIKKVIIITPRDVACSSGPQPLWDQRPVLL